MEKKSAKDLALAAISLAASLDDKLQMNVIYRVTLLVVTVVLLFTNRY